MPRWEINFDMRLQVDNPRVVQLVAKVEALASVIRGIPVPPHVQHRLDRLNVLRAVRGTTGIEGTELTEDEVAEILSAPSDHNILGGTRNREKQEVRNAEALMMHVAEMLRRDPTVPLNEQTIRRFHEIITSDIEYDHNEPGRYRTYGVNASSYLPPETGEEVQSLMAEFIDWFNTGRPSEWNPVIRAIVGHFYTISIHPFGDGNGRTSRAVESYLLFQAGVNARGFYSLANYYYRNRSDYVNNLDYVRFNSDGDLTQFVIFALIGLAEELEAVHGEVLEEVQVISFRDYARETLGAEGKLGTPVGERLFHFPLGLGRDPISLKSLRSREHPLSHIYLDVTNKTLMRDIHFLQQHQLVKVDGDSLQMNLEIMEQFTV